MAIAVPQDSSWTVRKLFTLRALGQPLIKYIVGNGSNICLRLDNWHTLGSSYKIFGERAVRDLGSSLLAKVSSIIDNGSWKWPRQRNSTILHIMAHTPTFLPDVNQSDRVIWTPATNGLFSVKSAWNASREYRDKIP